MLRGGCFCGAVRYETDAAPSDETTCHCTDCRRAVGSVAVAWFTVPRASLRVTGTPREFRSSPAVTRSFCATCGASLFYAPDPPVAEVDVSIGSLDDPGAVAPKDHIHVASRPRWAVIVDGLPIYRGSRGEG